MRRIASISDEAQALLRGAGGVDVPVAVSAVVARRAAGLPGGVRSSPPTGAG